MSLWLPFLSADCLRLSRPAGHTADEARPLVFIEKIKGVSRIVKADARALKHGIKSDMALADARVRIPVLRAVLLDRAADNALIAHLADVCLAFTPSLAIEEPDGLVLDITGCAHLFGGEAGLARRALMTLRRNGISSAQFAIATTPEMARALARFGRGCPIIDQDASKVRSLPVAALECSGEDTLALKRAGLKTIGDIADRPSVLFSSRFKQAFTAKLGRILGEEDQRIVPLAVPPPYLLDHQCPEPVASTEIISAILKELAQQASRLLEERGEGGRVFEAVFFRTDGAVRRIRIETSEPTRAPAVVMRLYRDRLEALADPLDPGFGFDVIRLHVVGAEPYDVRQASLDARDERREQLSHLIDRLGAIFGHERVVRLHPADTHIPEQAQTVVPASGRNSVASWGEAETGAPPSRPLHLFEPAHPIEMHGNPGWFLWRRVRHEIARSEGPERLAEAWWERQRGHGTRDYYRVETPKGRRFWLFRADGTAIGDTPRWFLHGVFA